MTIMINPVLPPARRQSAHRMMAHVKTAMREMWIVPMVVMGSLLCGGGFTLLSHLLGHNG